MKKLFIFVMLLSLAFAGCSGRKAASNTMASGEEDNEVFAPQKNAAFNTPKNETAWKTLYTEELLAAQEYAAAFDWENYNNRYPRYISNIQLADLDFDGTPELLISGESVLASFFLNIYTVVDGRSELIYVGLINKGPNLYRAPDGGLLYSFTELYSLSDEYVFTVYETNAYTRLPLISEGAAEKKAVFSMTFSEDTTYTFNGQAVSEDNYDSMVGSLYNGFEELSEYPLSISNIFDDRDWDTAGGFSKNDLLRFMDSYK